jgi:hypothetical protein
MTASSERVQRRLQRVPAGLLVAVWLASALPASAGNGTRDYLVRDGDSCLGIAIRELGDRSAVRQIHKLNPQLGELPHDLVPGQVLKLPGTMEASADAKLTDRRGDVQIRRAGEDEWNRASSGADLYRAWRVGARERATAEITFADTSTIAMRQNTVVVIFGKGGGSQAARASATLEQGTLRSRLAELDGALAVSTVSADATLTTGRALVSLDSTGKTRVATHSGGGSTVRGKKKKRAVKVAAGFGSAVERGKDPTPPAPLPPTPAWTQAPALVLATGAGNLVGSPGSAAATLAAAWQPVAGAVRYRVELSLDAEQREIVNAIEVGADVASVEVQQVPAGEYFIAVTALDAAGFESIPAPPQAVRIMGLALPLQPGGTVALGAAVPVQPGLTCGLDGDAAYAPAFVVAGARTLRCRDDAGHEATVNVNVGAAEVVQPARPPALRIGGPPVETLVTLTAPVDAAASLSLRTPPGVHVDALAATSTGVRAVLRAEAGASVGPGQLDVLLSPAGGAAPVQLGGFAIELTAPAERAQPPLPAARGGGLGAAAPARLRVGVLAGVTTTAGCADCPPEVLNPRQDGLEVVLGLTAQVPLRPWLAAEGAISRAPDVDAETLSTLGAQVAWPGRIRPALRAGVSLRQIGDPGAYAGAAVGIDLTPRLALSADATLRLAPDATREDRYYTLTTGLLWRAL